MPKKKTPELEFDNHIENIDALIKQLESLKQEAKVMFTSDQIFRDDFHALKIAVRYFKDLKEVIQ